MRRGTPRRLVSLLSAVLLVIGLVSTATVASASPSSTTPKVTAADPAGLFHPTGLTRVLNTVAGIGARKLAAGATVTVPVAGFGAIPASNVAAVAINLTVPNPTQAGSVAVFAGGATWNGAATVSFAAGQTEQGMLTESLGSAGTLSVRNGAKVAIDLIGDVTGYYTGGSATVSGSFVPLASSRRIIDTHLHPLASGSLTDFEVDGGLPSTGVAAIVVNLTVAARSGAGSLWVGLPSETDYSTRLMYTISGRTQQRMATVPLDSTHGVAVYNPPGAPMTLLVDLVGYYRSGAVTTPGGYRSLAPASRLYDTRTGGHTAIAPGASAFLYAGSAGTDDAQLDVTVVGPSAPGSVSVYPGSDSWAGVATMSFAAGSNYVRSVTTALGIDHSIRVRNNSSAPLTFVLTERATFAGSPSPLSVASSALIDANQGSAEGISCPTVTFCAGLQDNGFVTTYNGTSWDASTRLVGMSADRAANVGVALSGTYGISCVSASICVVVGRHIAMFDGTTWTVSQDATPLDLTGVSCVSTTFCMATGNDGSARRWDGSAWTATSSTGLSGGNHNDVESDVEISCTSSDFCLAAGTSQSAVWNGVTWLPAGTTAYLEFVRSISCVNPSFCVAVGRGASAEWTAGSWIPLSGPAEDDSVSCPTTMYCLSVGGDSDAHLGLLSNGSTTWTSVLGDAAPAAPRAVACVSSTRCLVLSGYHSAVAMEWNGSALAAPTTVDPGHGYLSGVSCAAVDRCLAVDRSGFYFTYDGSAWSGALALPAGSHPEAVSCPSSSFCMAGTGTGLVSTFDGASWAQPSSADTGAFLDVLSCGSASLCVGVDSNGNFVRWNGSGWTSPAAMPGGGAASAASCPTSNFCMLVGENGTASAWNGQSWSASVPAGVPATPAGTSCGTSGSCVNVSCSSSGYCLAQQVLQPTTPASASRTLVSEWNGASWHPIPTGPQDLPGQLSCGADQRCAAVGYDVGGWNGSHWTEVRGRWTSGGTDVVASCVGSNFCAVINSDAVGATLPLSW